MAAQVGARRTLADMEMVVAALIPSLSVGLLFWYVVRLIISADRNERKALAELDRRAAAENRPVDAHGDARGRSADETQGRSDT